MCVLKSPSFDRMDNGSTHMYFPHASGQGMEVEEVQSNVLLNN